MSQRHTHNMTLYGYLMKLEKTASAVVFNPYKNERLNKYWSLVNIVISEVKSECWGNYAFTGKFSTIFFFLTVTIYLKCFS